MRVRVSYEGCLTVCSQLIGCSLQVQQSHWSTVLREGSNHRRVPSARGGANTLAPKISLSHTHTRTHTRRALFSEINGAAQTSPGPRMNIH